MATEAFHVITETPANSGTYVETSEVITADADVAVLRCVELSQDGARYGFWVETLP
jgi:hypothetical protein